MNRITLEMDALAENVAIARVAVSTFISPLDPTVEEVTELKTAVSEAVTNAIIHGYGNNSDNDALEKSAQTVIITMFSENRLITIHVSDKGIGIENIETAREPLFTTKPDAERSGLGFTVMESFTDSVEVISHPGEGTTVKMTKTLKPGASE